MKQLSSIFNKLKKKNNIVMCLFTMYFLFLSYIFLTQETMESSKVFAAIGFLFIWLGVSFFLLLEIQLMKNLFARYAKGINASILMISPILSFLMTEVMVDNYNIGMFKKYGIYNIIWYFVIYYLIYTIIRSARYTIILGNVLIYVVAMMNYLVYLFRGNPIIPSDVLAWRTGMSVASSYDLLFTKEFMIATLIMYWILALGLKMEKAGNKPSVINRILVFGSFVVFFVFVYHMFFETELINKKIRVIDFFAPKYTYIDYGTAFGFVANAASMNTDYPKGYSLDIVRQALAQSTDEVEVKVIDKKPNIIVIMNEAFSDLSMLGEYKTNQDYLPYIRSLEENTTKGTLYVSVFGGATSDTEYEFLTGNSMAVMPRNCVPYQQFVTKPTDSMAATLKAQGYYNIAIHPYEPSGYKRDLVYPLLGFDEFLSIDDFQYPELIRSFISDRESYKKIIEQFENRQDENPLFIFNVTMQNHGGYSGDQIFAEEETVRFTKDLGHKRVEQYLSLVRESDKAFEYLTTYFSNQKEPTLILLYGDHQPVVYSDFYETMTDMNQINQLKYQVPFILWANYDIKEDDVDKLSANYLSSYLLNIAGLQGTAYNQYLMNLYKDVPVINGLYYIDKESIFHNLTDTSKYYDRIMEYRYVGYNNALDKKDKLNEYFYLK